MEIENQEAPATGGGLDALDRIALEASGDENAQAAAEDALLNPPNPNAVDPAAAWAKLPMIFGGIIGMALPEVKAAYTQEACLEWGAAMAAVSEKYGWEAGDVMAEWAPEIALAMATFPLAAPVYKAIQKRKEKPLKDKTKDVEDVEHTEAAPAAPASDTPSTDLNHE